MKDVFVYCCIDLQRLSVTFSFSYMTWTWTTLLNMDMDMDMDMDMAGWQDMSCTWPCTPITTWACRYDDRALYC